MEIVVCPCCGAKLKITGLDDGLLEAVFFDASLAQDELNAILQERGYVFGLARREGGENEWNRPE